MNTDDINVKNRKPQLFVWTKEATAGLLLFLAIFVFYAVKAPAFSVPGRWAGIAASFTGLDPFRMFVRPVWSALMWLLSGLPVANIGQAINLVTSLTGAGVCWLLYEIVRRISFVRTLNRQGRDAVEQVPRMMAGLFAGLFAAVSLPMIIVSTRGDFAVFDVFLILLAVYPSMLYRQKPRIACLYISCFIYGLGLADYPVMAAILPGFLAWWVVVIWKKAVPKTSMLFMAVMLLIAGFAVTLVYSGVMAGSRVAEFRGISGSGQVFVEYARLYYLELTRSVPRVGWLLIFGMNILPFLFVMFSKLEEPTEKYSAIGIYAFRLILLALGLITLFNLSGSPSRMVGPQVLLLAPSILVAVWFGYLIGYYYGILTRINYSFFRYAYAAFWVGLFLFAGYRHAAETSVVRAEPVVQFADDVIVGMGDRSYLITDGVLDSSLRLAARKADKTVHLINLAAGNDRHYGRYHASLFVAHDLQNMARLGVMPLIHEWLGRDTNITSQAAFLTVPDIAEAHNLIGVPDRVMYRIENKGVLPSPDDLFQAHLHYWNTAAIPDANDMQPHDAGLMQTHHAMRWLSRVANDLGVTMEEQQRDELAQSAYEKAIEIWPDNISAMLNLFNWAKRSHPEDVEKYQTMLDKQVGQHRNAFDLRYLTQVCGQVRDTSIMLGEASMLGKAGQDQLALSRLERAAGLIVEEDVAAQLSLARLYLRGQKVDESDAIYRRMLESNPDNTAAWNGLLRIALQRRQYEEANHILNRLEQLGAESQFIQLERASLNAAQGNFDEAKKQLQELTRQASPPIDAWYILGLIALAEQDEESFNNVAPALEVNRYYMPGMLLLGEHAMKKLQFDTARGYLEQALVLDPANIKILERLILLDYTARDANTLHERSAALLSVAPDHPLGHYGAANVYIAARQFDRAEVSLRRCLAIQSFGPAHNDLAWILGESGNLDEALFHAQKATALNEKDPNLWDTLAVIHLKRREIDEAAQSIEKALSQGGDRSVNILLHAGEIYLAAENEVKLSELVARLDIMKYFMTQDGVKSLDEFIKRVESASNR